MRMLLIILILLGLSGCGKSLHIIYKHKDISVIDEKTKQICTRSYSSWDGRVWKDYYPEPCGVFIEDVAEPVK